MPHGHVFETTPCVLVVLLVLVLLIVLLGELSDQERDQLEELYFSDDEQFELLSALEDELVHDYVAGALPEEETKRFEEHNLQSPRVAKKAERAKALQQSTGLDT